MYFWTRSTTTGITEPASNKAIVTLKTFKCRGFARIRCNAVPKSIQTAELGSATKNKTNPIISICRVKSALIVVNAAIALVPVTQAFGLIHWNNAAWTKVKGLDWPSCALARPEIAINHDRYNKYRTPKTWINACNKVKRSNKNPKPNPMAKNMVGNPKQIPIRCGMLARAPKFKPDVIIIILLGPGVNAAIIANTSSDGRLSTVLIQLIND